MQDLFNKSRIKILFTNLAVYLVGFFCLTFWLTIKYQDYSKSVFSGLFATIMTLAIDLAEFLFPSRHWINIGNLWIFLLVFLISIWVNYRFFKKPIKIAAKYSLVSLAVVTGIFLFITITLVCIREGIETKLIMEAPNA